MFNINLPKIVTIFHLYSEKKKIVRGRLQLIAEFRIQRAGAANRNQNLP